MPDADTPYIICQGDDIYTVAARHGHVWETLWKHEDNEHLKANGRTPNQLLAGETLVIPATRPHDADCAIEQKHRFRKKGTHVELRIVVTDMGMPRTDEPYYLEGEPPIHKHKGQTAKTSAEGLAVVKVPLSLTRAVLVVGDKKDRYELLIGHMDPPDTDSGKHARLENLGFCCGSLHRWDEHSDDAMNEFHRAHDHPEAVERDTAADHERLKEGYGS